MLASTCNASTQCMGSGAANLTGEPCVMKTDHSLLADMFFLAIMIVFWSSHEQVPFIYFQF